MKQAAILASLVAGMAAANAHGPHHHHHEHARRDADAATTWTYTTVWDYVTVTAGQSSTTAAPVNPVNPGNQGAGKNMAKAGDQVKAEDVNPNPYPNPNPNPSPSPSPNPNPNDPVAIQNQHIAEQNSKIAAQESINAHQEAINNGAAGGPVVSTTSTSAQAPPTPPPAVNPPQNGGSTYGSTGGSTGGVGKTNKGYGTYYGAEGGYGSCGDKLSDDGHTVALASSLMTSGKIYCGHTVTIQLSNGQTFDATVADTCPGCDDDPWGHIDIVTGWAHQLDPNIEVAGHVDISWTLH